jgi:hypothetical protein
VRRVRETDDAANWANVPAVITTSPAELAAAAQQRRRAKLEIKRFHPLSVLKVSLLFYFCLMLIVFFALLIVYWVLGLIGALNSLSHFLSNLNLGGKAGFQFNGPFIFVRIFLFGLAGVVVWSLVTVCLALLYNLVADVLGGIRVTVSEPR